MKLIKLFSFNAVIIGFSLLVSSVYAGTIKYSLNVDIFPVKQLLQGQVEIFTEQAIDVDVSSFSNVKLNNQPVKSSARTILSLPPGKTHIIEYQFSMANSSNFSNAEHVILSGNWYPGIEPLAYYQLQVSLPAGFRAISEANEIKVRKLSDTRNVYHFDFPHKLDGLSLAASKNYQVKKLEANGILIEAWFMQHNAHLMDRYLNYARDYLKLYNQLLGTFPYKRFTMVESPLPSGHAMPTYTLLGGRVIALPFIVETSLGHEILHQWFGNSVYVDYRHGNWSEGLTNYLADYYYAERKGQDKSYRKGMIRQYMAYVSKDNAFPVREFISRTDKTSSAIGYSKAAMIFHQLRLYFGHEQFIQALREFIADNQFRRASWHDLQKHFDSISKEPLYEDFQDWLTRTDLARISIARSAELELAQGQLWINFALYQPFPYHLHLPLRFTFSDNRQQTIQLHFTERFQEFRLPLPEVPVSAHLDPQFHLMRELNDLERVPDLAWLMGRKKVYLAVSANEKKRYEQLLSKLGIKELILIDAKNLTFEQMQTHSLIIAGQDNSLTKLLFAGQPQSNNADVSLSVKRNPYNEKEVIALVNAKDNINLQRIAYKLRHYGKYSLLQFKDGEIQHKETVKSTDGIKLLEQTPTRAISPPKTTSLEAIVNNLNGQRIILIGEQHDRFEHHVNQLQLIRLLKQAGYKVAVGMEMFQQPYQPAIDDYFSGKLTEAEFLTQSQYFDKWVYDYNLYKPIIDYLLEQQIPLLALNIEANVTKEVARKGLYDLTEDNQKQLPDTMNFDNWLYRHELKSIFKLHEDMLDRSSMKFNHFLQNQVLWDESMASRANQFLQNNPDYILVILAGNGHLQYKHGIPQRLQRLSGLKPLVIVQDEELTDDIADFVLLTTPIKGRLTPKIGVYLNRETPNQIIVDRIQQSSLASASDIRQGDIILSLNNTPVKSYADLRLALLYAEISKPVPITLKRDNNILNKELVFSASDASPHWERIHGTKK
jgi:uncharacterized iron-regulated protein